MPDGPEAQRIARTIPFYPFKGIDRFYDIGGILCMCHTIYHLLSASSRPVHAGFGASSALRELQRVEEIMVVYPSYSLVVAYSLL